jgi:hypothetical protein
LMTRYDSATAQAVHRMKEGPRMFGWLRQLWLDLTRWSGEIEDRGNEEAADGERIKQAMLNAQERKLRVESIKREVKIVMRRYH